VIEKYYFICSWYEDKYVDNYTGSLFNESWAVPSDARVWMDSRKHRVVSISNEVRAKVIG